MADTNNSFEQTANTQRFNEALIRLMVILYQADKKVTLTEQDYFNTKVEGFSWHSGIALEAFVSQAIHEARIAVDSSTSLDYLRSLGADLNLDPATAFEVAMDITAVDGKRSDEELELLSLLSNRILAKGLVA